MRVRVSSSSDQKTAGRGLLPDLETSHPIASMLPVLYQEDDFTRRFTAGLDEILAPLFCTLDNLERYFEPELAPVDFVEWLSGWVGVVLDETWGLKRQRALVSQAIELYRWRGTRRGLAALVAIYTGGEVEVTDSGGAYWSPVPGSDLPGTAGYRVKIRVVIPEGTTINPERLDRVVAAAKPAHVTHEIELNPG
ncbi:MAG: phage tail protein [Actinomycetota bacterium]